MIVFRAKYRVRRKAIVGHGQLRLSIVEERKRLVCVEGVSGADLLWLKTSEVHKPVNTLPTLSGDTQVRAKIVTVKRES
jgi:hypothetical protein